MSKTNTKILEYARERLATCEKGLSLENWLMACETIRSLAQEDGYFCGPEDEELIRSIWEWDQQRDYPYFKDREHVQRYLEERPVKPTERWRDVFEREIRFLRRNNKSIVAEGVLRDEATIAVLERKYELALNLVSALATDEQWFLYEKDTATPIRGQDDLLKLIRRGALKLPWVNMNPPRFQEYLAALKSGHLDTLENAWGHISIFRCGELAFQLTERCWDGKKVIEAEFSCFSAPSELTDPQMLNFTWQRTAFLNGNFARVEEGVTAQLSSQIARVEEAYVPEELLRRALREVHVW